MNPDNGNTIWSKVRPSDAKKESLESFGTVIPYRNQLLIAGGDVLTGHEPDTGMKFGVGALGTRAIKNSGGDLYHLQLWVEELFWSVLPKKLLYMQ